MICTVCYTDYKEQANHWRFDGYITNEESMYTVESAVVTPAILQAIFEHALQNEHFTIAVNTYAAEYVNCEGCLRLQLQLKQACEAILNMPRFDKVTYYDDF